MRIEIRESLTAFASVVRGFPVHRLGSFVSSSEIPVIDCKGVHVSVELAISGSRGRYTLEAIQGFPP